MRVEMCVPLNLRECERAKKVVPRAKIVNIRLGSSISI